MKKRVGTTVAIGLISWATAELRADGSQLQIADNPVFVQPQRLAGARLDGGKLRQVTPWMDYVPGGIAQTVCSTTLCFDNFEPDGAFPGLPTEGAPNGGYDPECGLGGARWRYGDEFLDPFVTNDMSVAPGGEGLAANRVEFAWYWYVHGAGSAAECQVAVFTAEDFDDTCNGFDLDGDGLSDSGADNYYSGVIYDFGVLPTSQPSYYFADIADLCDFGLHHQMPLDGRGAYSILLISNGPGCQLTPCSYGQPMLWGPKSGNPNGSQGPIQWDDISPIDGQHRNDGYECGFLGFGICPDPLGAMIAFYADRGGCPFPVGDANCDGAADFFDLDLFITLLVQGTPPCAFCAVDANGDGYLDFFDIDPFVECLLTGGC